MVSCKTEIYETHREFDDAVSWQYTKRRRKRSERVCAGALTAGELKCLKVLIDEDANRQYWQLQEMTAQAKRPSIHRPDQHRRQHQRQGAWLGVFAQAQSVCCR